MVMRTLFETLTPKTGGREFSDITINILHEKLREYCKSYVDEIDNTYLENSERTHFSTTNITILINKISRNFKNSIIFSFCVTKRIFSCEY